MSLSLRRYHESPKTTSSLMLNKKYSNSKQKISFLNSSSSLPKNPEVEIHLPSLSSQRSSMRKTFSTTFQSDRNTKFKLVTLEDKLEQFKAQLYQTRQQTKETIEFTAMLRQSLVNKQLFGMQKDLKYQIQGLQNVVSCIKNDNKLRSNDLRNDCGELWNSTQNLKEHLFQLRMRVQEVQRTMGFKDQ